MIRLPNVFLSPVASNWLRKWQLEIDVLPTYQEKVTTAAAKFSGRNRQGKKTFDAVKSALSEMCCGFQRCVYCEDSFADEVEHIKPKNLYPECVFSWDNYVYACGPCNGPKNNRFSVFRATDGIEIDVTRKRNDPVIQPVQGTPLLINPRDDDPLDYFDLDIVDTFLYLPRMGLDQRAKRRAQFSIELLRLNTRPHLPAARREAFRSLRDHLIAYIALRGDGANQQELAQRVTSIRRHNFAGVWAEMKRQQAAIPELKSLFDAVPEATTW